MSEKTKVTKGYLQNLGSQRIGPMQKAVSEKKSDSAEHYGKESINVPFGNGDLMGSAAVLASEVSGVLTKFHAEITRLEERLLVMHSGIQDSDLFFEKLESDAELDASKVNTIMNNGSTTGGSTTGDTTTDPTK
ncbi:hypothetical protein ACFW31_01265 [Nocardiopsis alba]|uniref:hypothetical protein n=1 Tax=Nocardiopsis alba TaxID=53437 RepID=UPI00366BB9F6